MIKKILLVTSSLFLLTSLSIADEFKTTTKLGYMSSTGNSDVSAGSVLFDASKKFDKNELKAHYEWYYSEENSVENKNKMLGNINCLYNFSDLLSFDYILQGEKDKFSGFDYKVFTGPGFKYKVINEKENPNYLEIGANIVAETDKPEHESADNYAALLAKEKYTFTFSNNLKFKQDLSYRVDVSDYEVYSLTGNIGFENKLNEFFSLGVNYKIDYTNKVASNIEHTDKIFTASLIINY